MRGRHTLASPVDAYYMVMNAQPDSGLSGMQSRLTIVIPVYNAFSESRACLESVQATAPSWVHILVIDDASPNGNFKSHIPELLADPRLTVIRNEKNLGFVRTCNTAIQMRVEDDIVLLNSDTIVTSRWIEKLSAAAYSENDIATVTPFTNNGTICSIPHFCEDNIVPAGMTIDQFADMVESVAAPEYPELPTSVGFCVYITRAALSVVGELDAEAFCEGYGEEVDFSLRARQKGLRNILDPSTYIYHTGTCSFLGLKKEYLARSERILKQKYPHYFDEVSKFYHRNPLASAHARIYDRIAEWWNENRPRVLHILHNGPYIARVDPLGGTEFHVQDLIASASEFVHWSLVADPRFYFLTCHIPGCTYQNVLRRSEVSLEQILANVSFDAIHLHHTRWFDHDELCEELARHSNVIVSTHDFTLACPRHHLVTPDNRYCSGFECTQACGFTGSVITSRRAASRRLLESAGAVVCFSNSTRQELTRLIENQSSWQFIPHGIPHIATTRTPNRESPCVADSVQVAFVGTITERKGAALIHSLLETKTIAGKKIEWHFFGVNSVPVSGAHIHCHGTYQRSELAVQMRSAGVHVALFLSIWPETYLLTLDEVLSLGVPAIVGPLGAPAERIAQSGAGLVLAENTSDAVFDALERIITRPETYTAMLDGLAETSISSIQAEGLAHAQLYRDLSLDARNQQPFGAFLAAHRTTFFERTGVALRVGGKFINTVIFVLDAVGFRARVQKLAQRVLPERLLTSLKSVR